MVGVGGSELVVGSAASSRCTSTPTIPAPCLRTSTRLGEVAEVHINNMRRQTAERDAELESEHAASPPGPGRRKPVGFVAVAAGAGLARDLRVLGVDVVVSGGQTMNPSTAGPRWTRSHQVPAEKVVVLPNNKNIVMAASSAAHRSLTGRSPWSRRPRVPQAFAALLAYDGTTDDLEAIAPTMAEAARRGAHAAK